MTESTTHQVTVRRTRDDYFAFSREVRKGLRSIGVYVLVTYVVILTVYLRMLDLAIQRQWLPARLIASKPAMIVLSFAFIYVMLRVVNRLFMPMYKREYLNDKQAFLSDKHVTIDARGLHEHSEMSDIFWSWKGVVRIERSTHYLLAYIDKLQAFCIPIRNFEDSKQADQFYENMLSYWRAAHSQI